MAELLLFKFLFVTLMNKCSIMKTHDFILQKTFGLLLQKGYDGVSVSDIQQVTGMARGLLYHYFGNLDRLFEEVVETWYRTWMGYDRETLKGKSVVELITFMVERYRCIGQDLQEYHDRVISFSDVEILFREAVRHQSSFAELYTKVQEEHYIIWKTALLNSFSRGELRSGLNLESVARHFVFIRDGIVFHTGVGSLNDHIYLLEKGLREYFEIIRR